MLLSNPLESGGAQTLSAPARRRRGENSAAVVQNKELFSECGIFEMSLAAKVHSKHDWFSKLVGKYYVFDDGSDHAKLVWHGAGCGVAY